MDETKNALAIAEIKGEIKAVRSEMEAVKSRIEAKLAQMSEDNAKRETRMLLTVIAAMAVAVTVIGFIIHWPTA